MPTEFPFYLAGKPTRSDEQLDVTNPYDDSVIGRTWLAGNDEFGGPLYEPTVLADVPRDARVRAQEAFAPLVVVEPVASVDEAIGEVNRSTYGLQAGIFTADLERGLRAFDEIEVGGVMINDVPTYRIDNMPYGGVKDSGLGREGPKYTIEEMTEPRLLVINRRGR